MSLSHGNWVPEVEFSPDGRRVLTGSCDMNARVWDLATGQPLTPPPFLGNGVVRTTFSPEGRRVLTAGGDGTVRLWDLASNLPMGKP